MFDCLTFSRKWISGEAQKRAKQLDGMCCSNIFSFSLDTSKFKYHIICLTFYVWTLPDYNEILILLSLKLRVTLYQVYSNMRVYYNTARSISWDDKWRCIFGVTSDYCLNQVFRHWRKTYTLNLYINDNYWCDKMHCIMYVCIFDLLTHSRFVYLQQE